MARLKKGARSKKPTSLVFGVGPACIAKNALGSYNKELVGLGLRNKLGEGVGEFLAHGLPGLATVRRAASAANAAPSLAKPTPFVGDAWDLGLPARLPRNPLKLAMNFASVRP